MPSSPDALQTPRRGSPPAAAAAAAAGSPLYAIVEEAAQVARAPIALLTYLTEEAQWIVAAVGLEETRTSREAAFCAWAVHNAEVMFVEDATKDPRFHENPLVVGLPHVRFYAGAPIPAPDGVLVGTVCVLDRRPRPADGELAQRLHVLAGRAAEHLRRSPWEPRP